MEASAETMSVTSKAFVKAELGPFPSASEACTYCFASFTKKGDPPAGHGQGHMQAHRMISEHLKTSR